MRDAAPRQQAPRSAAIQAAGASGAHARETGIWAWASWRIGKMRRLVDHVLAALPFEHDWFTARGMSSTLVGHPFFDELDGRGPTAAGDVDRPLVLLLPGSRGQEIEGNLATILRSAVGVAEQVPAARFVVAVVRERHAARARETIRTLGPVVAALDLQVESGRARQLIGEAACAIAVSGSVSLELLAARVPAVVVYRISGFAYVVQSWLRHARFITLVNLLGARDPIGPPVPRWRPPREVAPADPEAIYPEYLAVQDPAARVTAHVVEWLTRPEARAAVVSRLDTVARDVAHGGSADRAAAAVLAIAAASRRRRDARAGASGPSPSPGCLPASRAA